MIGYDPFARDKAMLFCGGLIIVWTFIMYHLDTIINFFKRNKK